MTVALSRQTVKKWIDRAIDEFRANDLVDIPEAWMRVYRSLADYICEARIADDKLFWMMEGLEDHPPDMVYQLQRLKGAIVDQIVAEKAYEDLKPTLEWFDRLILALVEKTSGRVSEERGLALPFETIFWKARDGLYISTVEGKFLHCNDALVKMVGAKSEKQLQEMDIAAELYVDGDKRGEMLNHLLEDGFYDHHEFEFRTAGDGVKTAMESCYLVEGPKERFIVGIMVDITKEKEYERRARRYAQDVERRGMDTLLAMRRAHQRRESLMRVNDRPLVILDPKEFRLLDVNQAFVKRFKHRKKQLDQISFRDLFTPDGWIDVYTRVTESINRVNYHIRNVTCVDQESAVFVADLTVTVHQDEEGSALYVQIEDREKILALKSELASARQNLQRLVEDAPIGIIGFRADGGVDFINNFFHNYLGYSQRQLMKASFVNRLFAQDEHRLKFNKYVRQFLRGRHAVNQIIDLRAKSGRVLKFQLNTLPYRFEDDEDAGFLALLIDVSPRFELDDLRKKTDHAPDDAEKAILRLEEKVQLLHKMNEDLRRKNRARIEFFKILAKKFKTPIHVVLGFASFLSKDLADKVNDSQREDLIIIQDHIRFILNLLEKASEYAQLDDNEIPCVPEAYVVRALLDELFGKLRPERLADGVAFTAEHQILSLDLKIVTDANVLESLLRHLVDNAVMYTHSGRITLTAYEDQSGVWIEVNDTGIGVKPTDLARVFEPFFQASAESGAAKKSLGLGLPIAKKYADMLGAYIEIQSKVGQGTSVLVCLGKPERD